MKEKLFQWKSRQKAVNIHGQIWEPQSSNPQSVIILSHGQGEHIKRYDHLAAFFTNRNWVVIGNDHIGHGKSQGARGHINNYNEYLDEIDYLINFAKDNYPKLPIYLYGHSMGGAIVINFVLHRDTSSVKACIASAPWIELSFKPNPALVLLGRMLQNIWPTFSQPSGLDVSSLSTQQETIKRYVNDPLVHNKITARAGIVLMDRGKSILKHDTPLSVPLLIMHGNEDKITSFHASKSWAERPSNYIDFKSWEGYFHEIHNEDKPNLVFNYAYEWCSKQKLK